MIVDENKVALEILKLTVKKHVRSSLDEMLESIRNSIEVEKGEDIPSKDVPISGDDPDMNWKLMKSLILKFASEEAVTIAREAHLPGTLV